MGFGQSAQKLEKIPAGPRKEWALYLGDREETATWSLDWETERRCCKGMGDRDLEWAATVFKLYSVALMY